MNRVFKIIWNKTTQRQEVVSELAKGSAKASSASNNTQKAIKQFIISILTVLITSTLLASVSKLPLLITMIFLNKVLQSYQILIVKF
ncbi:ESPR domain-containing protein [Haemophilus influenzae]